MAEEQQCLDLAPASVKINEAINKIKNDSIHTNVGKSLKKRQNNISPGEEKEEKERKKKQLRIESFFPSKRATNTVSNNNNSSACQEAETCLLNANLNESASILKAERINLQDGTQIAERQ